MRRLLLIGAALALVSSSALGQTGQGARPRAPETLKNLSEKIPEVAFEEAPLDQVMDWLGTLSPMQVVVRWQVLEDAGIERDKPITMNVRDLRLSQVLWMVLKEAGGADLKLAYRASGRILTISTAEDLGQEMVVRVYDVSDLLVRAKRFTSAPHLDLAQAGQGGGGGGGGGSQNIFGGGGGSSGNDDNDQGSGGRAGEDNEDIQELIDLIVQTVEPDSWSENSGTGTIQAFRNLLVVRNNILVHQALGGYVEESD